MQDVLVDVAYAGGAGLGEILHQPFGGQSPIFKEDIVGTDGQRGHHRFRRVADEIFNHHERRTLGQYGGYIYFHNGRINPRIRRS